MSPTKPVKVAVIGGGCASMAAAFDLTRPEQGGRFEVTVYQLGWRLGGKGASGRGPADRIEEHGLHVWLGFYENAFRILRDCYQELGRDPAKCPISHWRDAFFPDPVVGVTDRGADGRWLRWLACFPPAEGEPGDRLDAATNPFTLPSYMLRTVRLLRVLLTEVQLRELSDAGPAQRAPSDLDAVIDVVARIARAAPAAAVAAVLEVVRMLETLLLATPMPPRPELLRVLDAAATALSGLVERLATKDEEVRRVWEVMDLTLAVMRGLVREGVLTSPRGLDILDDHDCREWLLMHGASRRSVDSAVVRGLYDLALAYDRGDPGKPVLAAGQAIRGALRMFFTYRGALFWKMRAGMGDVVFAPLYEVLSRRGVKFEFFHRLESVRLADESKVPAGARPWIESLEMDVQAEVAGGGEYRPLVDVRGLPCWPSSPDWSQLEGGERLRQDGWQFESWWDTRRARGKTLEVTKDFDLVVLGVGGGAVAHLTRELAEREPRWKTMLENVQTVATQAFQVWLKDDVEDLGWMHGPVNLSGFAKPFDTWADMRHLVPQESWDEPLGTIAYFCGVLACEREAPDRSQASHPAEQRHAAKQHAVEHLRKNVGHLWPRAADSAGELRWDLLADPAGGDANGPERFDSQFWTANVNPTDRYVLAPPGTLRHRISPLELLFDNLTICGDWTSCGFTEGCVESAVMSGRLASHALSGLPKLEDVIGFDHP